MAQEVKNVRFLQRADTTENWEKSTTALLAKEVGFETDTGKYKIGDGETLWKDLPYPTYGEVSQAELEEVDERLTNKIDNISSAVQYTNITGSHLEGNSTQGNIKGYSIESIDFDEYKVENTIQTLPITITATDGKIKAGMNFNIFGYANETSKKRLLRGTIKEVNGISITLQGYAKDTAFNKLQDYLKITANIDNRKTPGSITLALIVNGGTIGKFEVVDDLGIFSQYADGYKTTAGLTATATGNETQALGYGSFATGNKSVAKGERGFAINYTTQANGDESFAANDQSKANGRGSFATGKETEANGIFSFSSGVKSKAIGDYSRAGGIETQAIGIASTTEGEKTIASSNNQFVCGRYNEEDSADRYAVIVGNGYVDSDTNDIIKHNAFTLEWDGTAVFEGDIYANYHRYGSKESRLITEWELNSKLGHIEERLNEIYARQQELINSNGGSN